MSTSLSAIFSPNARNILICTTDNRIKLWDVDARKETRTYIERRHLSHTYKCWTRNNASAGELGLCAIGTSDGSVIVWDLTRGAVVKEIALSGEVPSDIAFSRDSKYLYVAASMNRIDLYEIASGELANGLKAGKKAVSKVCVNPKADVLAVGSSSVKLIDISTGRKRKLEAHFAGGVSSFTFSPCGRYLICCGDSKEVLVFDVQANASEQPICVTSTLGVPQFITTRSSGRILDVLLTLEGAGAMIVRIDTGKSLENSMEASSNISSSGEIFAAIFAEGSQDSVIFAFGSKEKPKFARVKFLSAEGTMVDDLVLPNSGPSSSSASHSVDGLRHATVEVLGPAQLGVTKRPHVVNDDLEESITSAKKQKGSELNGVADIVAATLTLEERLQNLSSSMTSLENGTVPTRRSLAPTSDSLVTVIDQALQARDDALLEQCLACDDIDVIDQTAKMLHTHRILELMTRLVAKFEKRPSRGLLLTRWLSCLLRHHTSFLVSVPDLAGQLAGLSQMLEQRLASYTRLSSLSGRLDLLLSQASGRGMSSLSARSASMEPSEVVYED